MLESSNILCLVVESVFGYQMIIRKPRSMCRLRLRQLWQLHAQLERALVHTYTDMS